MKLLCMLFGHRYIVGLTEIYAATEKLLGYEIIRKLVCTRCFKVTERLKGLHD